MMRNSIKLTVTFLVLLSMFTGCNPKPAIEEQERLSKSNYINNYQKLTEAQRIMDLKSPLHSGINQIMHFLDKPLVDEELKSIYVNETGSYYSTSDLLVICAKKGVYFTPVYGDVNKIIDELKQNDPVLVEAIISGSIKETVIFYGYSDQDLIFFDLANYKEQKILIEKLSDIAKNGEGLELFILDDEQTNKLLTNQSKLFWLIESRDAYYKDDKSKYKQVIEKIELNNWINDFKYFYSFYYVFIDFKPEKVEEIILDLVQEQGSVFDKELAFMLYIKENDLQHADTFLQDIEISDLLRDETLYAIVKRHLELGNTEKANEAYKILSTRNPEYPGIEELSKRMNSEEN
jgi:hypothetical protein